MSHLRDFKETSLVDIKEAKLNTSVDTTIVCSTNNKFFQDKGHTVITSAVKLLEQQYLNAGRSGVTVTVLVTDTQQRITIKMGELVLGPYVDSMRKMLDYCKKFRAKAAVLAPVATTKRKSKEPACSEYLTKIEREMSNYIGKVQPAAVLKTPQPQKPKIDDKTAQLCQQTTSVLAAALRLIPRKINIQINGDTRADEERKKTLAKRPAKSILADTKDEKFNVVFEPIEQLAKRLASQPGPGKTEIETALRRYESQIGELAFSRLASCLARTPGFTELANTSAFKTGSLREKAIAMFNAKIADTQIDVEQKVADSKNVASEIKELIKEIEDNPKKLSESELQPEKDKLLKKTEQFIILIIKDQLEATISALAEFMIAYMANECRELDDCRRKGNFMYMRGEGTDRDAEIVYGLLEATGKELWGGERGEIIDITSLKNDVHATPKPSPGPSPLTISSSVAGSPAAHTTLLPPAAAVVGEQLATLLQTLAQQNKPTTTPPAATTPPAFTM